MMPVLLIEDVAEYVSFAAIEPVTEGQYFRSVRCFSDFLKRPATRDDLNEKPVNAWLAHLSLTLSVFTVNGRKRGITPVWNWLARENKASWYNPRALRKTKLMYPPVRAWSIEQVQQLLAGAADLKGTLECGVQGKRIHERLRSDRIRDRVETHRHATTSLG
jgi:site-specific recombinase XerD